MIYCKNCKKRIDFIKSKNGNKIPVSARKEYFIPDEVSGTVIFVTSNGIIRKGRRASDGVAGYELHKCMERGVKNAG